MRKSLISCYEKSGFSACNQPYASQNVNGCAMIPISTNMIFLIKFFSRFFIVNGQFQILQTAIGFQQL